MIFVPDIPGASGNASGTWHVRGIVSLTVSRRDVAICDPYQYTIFTDVVQYKDWIGGYLDWGFDKFLVDSLFVFFSLEFRYMGWNKTFLILS